MPTMNGAQALVAQLEREGVRDLFGIPGVQMDWAHDALLDSRIRYHLPRHEQATSYMADGYARATGRPGVGMVVPGPGLLNAMAGLATAYACNSRVLCIAGQIHSSLIGAGRGLLHEIRDQSATLGSVTKWHGLALQAGQVPGLVHEAFRQMATGRPQPAGLEIPPDVLGQKAEVALVDPVGANASDAKTILPLAADIERAAGWASGAALPVIWAGGGALAAGAGAAVAALAEAIGAPIVLSENARGAVPDTHPLVVGALGGRVLLPRADLVLVIGSRFLDGRGDPILQRDGLRLVYVNAGAADLGAPRQPGLALPGDAAALARALCEAVGTRRAASFAGRVAMVAKVRAWCDEQIAYLQPQLDHVRAIRAALPDDGIVVTEMTQIGYVANLAFPVREGGLYIGAGYQGTLGYGFPTALGAAIGAAGTRGPGSARGRFTVSINGDGGFGWSLQELATAARAGADLAVLVFVDHAFGNVKRIQRAAFGREIAVDLHNPDFVALAGAFGVPAERAEGAAALQAAIERARARGGPTLIEVQVGEMPGPWHLVHKFSKAPRPAPADPLA